MARALHTTMKLIKHRSEKRLKGEYTNYQYCDDEDQLRQRSRSINRHATIIHLPPTLLHSPFPEPSLSARVEPTILIYNSETVETLSYTSIANIRTIRNNECLWIDVPSVRMLL